MNKIIDAGFFNHLKVKPELLEFESVYTYVRLSFRVKEELTENGELQSLLLVLGTLNGKEGYMLFDNSDNELLYKYERFPNKYGSFENPEDGENDIYNYIYSQIEDQFNGSIESYHTPN